MVERSKLFAYLLVIVVASWMTAAVWLAGGLLVVLAFCGRDATRLLRRAVLTTITFSGSVSLAYVGYAWWTSHRLPLDWLLTVNLRVLLMALLTFLFVARVNLFKALSFSHRLSFLLVLATSQSLSLKRTLEEFRLGLASRSVRPASLRTRYRATAHMIGWLLDRALANAHESAQALQSRGGFR